MSAVLVCGEPWEPGCYVDGWHGQYAMGEAVELARSLGFEPGPDADAALGAQRARDDFDLETVADACDRAESFLNDATEGGSWSWQDGELFLEADDDPVMVRNRAVPVPNVHGCQAVAWWPTTPPADEWEAGGETLHGSALRAAERWTDPADMFGIELPVTWGDYCGSTYERANYGWLLEQYGQDVFVRVHWAYGEQGLVLPYSADPDTFAAVLEDVAGLADYPLFSDEALSELESELTLECLRWWTEVEHEWDDCFSDDVADDERLQRVFEAYFDGPADHDPIVFESAVDGYITPGARDAIRDLLTRVEVDQ